MVIGILYIDLSTKAGSISSIQTQSSGRLCSTAVRASRLSLVMMDELKRPPLVEEGGEEMMPRLMPSLSSMEEGESAF